MTTEIIPTAQAEQTVAGTFDGGQGLVISMAVLVLLGVLVILIIAS
jgi:hypothetical protein